MGSSPLRKKTDALASCHLCPTSRSSESAAVAALTGGTKQARQGLKRGILLSPGGGPFDKLRVNAWPTLWFCRRSAA